MCFGTLIAILFTPFSDALSFSSINFKIKVRGPGQIFCAIFSESLSNSTIFAATSFEKAKIGSDFEISLDLIL